MFFLVLWYVQLMHYVALAGSSKHRYSSHAIKIFSFTGSPKIQQIYKYLSQPESIEDVDDLRSLSPGKGTYGIGKLKTNFGSIRWSMCMWSLLKYLSDNDDTATSKKLQFRWLAAIDKIVRNQRNNHNRPSFSLLHLVDKLSMQFSGTLEHYCEL